MSLMQIYTTSTNPDFQTRVRSAILKAANAIVGEDGTAFSQSKADKRHTLGIRVLDGGGSVVSGWINSVASYIGEVEDPATLSDGQIEGAVSALWNNMAGVSFGE